MMHTRLVEIRYGHRIGILYQIENWSSDHIFSYTVKEYTANLVEELPLPPARRGRIHLNAQDAIGEFMFRCDYSVQEEVDRDKLAGLPIEMLKILVSNMEKDGTT